MKYTTAKAKRYALPGFLIFTLLFFTVAFAIPVSGDHEGVNGDYYPDYEIPDTDFKVFFSDTPPAEVDEEEDGDGDDEGTDEVDFTDPDLGEPRSISDIISDQHGDPQTYAGAVDVSYYITPSLMEFYGWTLSDYRHNQLVGFATSSSDSHILEPWEDETKDEKSIKDAYMGIVGLSPEGYPTFEFEGEQSAEDLDRQLFAANEGDVLTYLDFEVDEDEIPEGGVPGDIVTHTENGEEVRQTQDLITYQVQQFDADRELTIEGDVANIPHSIESGVGGKSLEYEDTINQEVEFHVDAEIWVDIYEYHWERERDMIHDDRRILVTGDTDETAYGTGTGSTTVEHGPDSEGETISGAASGTCQASRSITGTVDMTEERTITELGGDRQIDIVEDVNFEASGTPSGPCAGTVTGEAGSGNSTTISGDISGDVALTGSEWVTVEYKYWDHWDSEANNDYDGWELQETEHERTDTVEVEDSISAYITDNNDVEIEQIAVEVEEGARYHSILRVNYDGHTEGFAVWPHQMDRMYYWSMLMFGERTYVDSDWKAYSYTRYGETYDEERFPNQLGVDLFSENNGPRLTSVSADSHQDPVLHDNNHRNPELYGWSGDETQIETYDIHENAGFETGQPAFYHTFVVKNVPEPASELISIHGTEREVLPSETTEIPYTEPDVSLTYNPVADTVEISVSGQDGEPLPGRDLLVAGNVGDAEVTTNTAGEATVDIAPGINHVQVEVQGDDIDEILTGDTPDVYYGSVTATKTVGFPGVIGHLYDAIMQIMFSIPLVLFYLLWRDAELGM